jgi:hypothetical protein
LRMLLLLHIGVRRQRTSAKLGCRFIRLRRSLTAGATSRGVGRPTASRTPSRLFQAPRSCQYSHTWRSKGAKHVLTRLARMKPCSDLVHVPTYTTTPRPMRRPYERRVLRLVDFVRARERTKHITQGITNETVAIIHFTCFPFMPPDSDCR